MGLLQLQFGRSAASPPLQTVPPSPSESQILTPKGGPPALPGWQQKFDFYGSRPPMKLPIVSQQAHEREFHDGRV